MPRIADLSVSELLHLGSATVRTSHSLHLSSLETFGVAGETTTRGSSRTWRFNRILSGALCHPGLHVLWAVATHAEDACGPVIRQDKHS